MKILIFGILAISLMSSDCIAACNVCHSKKPEMRRMHEALGYKDCFKCHGMGQIRKGEEKKIQMKQDPLCRDCHNK